uniref:Rho GTPase activating protein 21 n=1 Tax=Nothobranchius kuhntae TaxID=321403 RepID=A0A1A8IF06_NOTKU
MEFSRDITALAYSQDAYLKGNEAYSGNAQNIPEPPPLCYPRIELNPAGMAQLSELAPVSDTPRGPVPGPGRRAAAVENSYRVEIPVPPSLPLQQQVLKTQAVVCVSTENVRTPDILPDPVDRGSRVARAGPSHRTEENRYNSSAESGTSRPKPIIPSVPGGAQLQYTSSHLTETPNFSPSSTSRPDTVLSETLSPPVPAPTAAASSDLFSSAISPSTNHYSPSPTAPSTSPHQNIDWRTYTTYKDYIDAKRLHTYGCRTIQERLDSLRAATSSSSAYTQKRTPTSCNNQKGMSGSQGRRRSASNDRGGDTGGRCATVTAPLRSVSQERLGGPAERTTRNWPRSASQDALPFSNAIRVIKPRARSCDYLSQQLGEQGGVVSGDRAAVEERLLLCDGGKKQETSQRVLPHLSRSLTGQEEDGRTGGLLNSPEAAPDSTKGTADSASPRPDGLIMRPSRLPVKNSISDLSPALSSIKTTDPPKDQKANIMGNHLSYSSPLNLQLRGRADSLKMEGRLDSGLTARSSSCSGASSKLPMHRQLQSGVATITSSSSSTGAATQKPNVKVTSSSTSALERTNGGFSERVEGPDTTVVVLRRGKLSGGARVRPPSYVLAVNDNRSAAKHKSPPLVKAGSADGAMCWMSNESCRRRLRDTRHEISGSNNLDDSLDSIPFIDEPSSPSLDLDSTHISASVVMSAAPLVTTIPPSPTSSSPLICRQLSHDEDSGLKTERSKSYDEGIDIYQEEGRGGSMLPGLKGLRKAVDRSSDDSGSRRDSSSDVFCDATKEGFLHFKQLHLEKGKRVGGGGMRQWKQMYGVLRGHYLCLYKDKKEGQAHASCQTVEEPLQISIKACLIDISYSDTKRKNVLRLTTSDCEYLFQAEDREDMLAWIRVIQENSNVDEENSAFTSHDLISRKIKEYNTLMSPTGSKTEPSPRASRQSLSIRQTLLGGKGETKATSPHSPKPEQERKNLHKDDTSPPKDKGTWRKGIPGLMRKPFEKKPSPGVTFGVRLDDCPPALNNKFVPLIVEVCYSPASDSAKSKGSWGSGKERELLVSSLFAAANRKRKKSREKPQPSSSDDELEALFSKNHSPQMEEQAKTHPSPESNTKQQEEKKESRRSVEFTSKAKKEHRNSLFFREKTPPRRASASPSQGKSSLSDPPSQLDENTSDLGTISSGASVPRSRPKKWTGGAIPDLPAGVGPGAVAETAAGTEVSSITSDYSTTSSITFLTGAESIVLSPELHGGEEADDERSELISEGRPMETDSESEFPVFAPGGGSSQSTPRPDQSQNAEARGEKGAAERSASPKPEARRLFPTHRMIECDTLSRRWSLRHKTDSDSSAEGAVGSGERNEGRTESSSRLSRVLEVMKKGRSTSSISSSSRSESDRSEPAWHLKITERLKFRLRSPADDMFSQRSRGLDARGKKKNIRRRHTLGGQRDFAELAVINDWREQGGVDQTADLSPLDHPKPRSSSQDYSIRDWIPRERRRCSGPNAEVAPKAEPEDDHPEASDLVPENPSPSPDAQLPAGDHVNGSGLQDKNKTSLGTDAHPHKLSGGQVVRSRFYQYL